MSPQKTSGTSSFGQICYYPLDGQVYGQPLVVTNVPWNGGGGQTVVYVVTQNASVYAFNGSPAKNTTAPSQCSAPLAQVSLLNNNFANQPAMAPANCGYLGQGTCTTMAPNVGILGTPVIHIANGAGTLCVIAEMQSGTAAPFKYYHFLHALDIKTLNEVTSIGSPVQICPVTGCSSFSQLHIQRPGLLYGADGYLYIALSMMDGNISPLPNGVILAYNAANLSSVSSFSLSEGISGADGAGVWQGGAGPAYGPDSSGTDFVFFSTANGAYSPSSSPPNEGDTFIKMTTAGSGSLAVSAAFTPSDQLNRSGGKDSGGHTCNAGGGSPGDYDFGSGGTMLIPDSELKDPYLAVLGDKESGIWFLDRTIPGGTTSAGVVPNGYNGGSCSGVSNGGTKYGVGDQNVQTFPIEGSGSTVSVGGPVIHTSPSFWELDNGTSSNNYLYLGSQGSTLPAGELMQYQMCVGTKKPIISGSGCTATGTAAYDPATGNPIPFPWGTTPSVSATSTTDTDALVWAIWADGSDIPSQSKFTWTDPNTKQVPFPASSNGVLYAFDAVSMKKLYGSNDCVVSGTRIDTINPATKYSIPSIANGYVYLGTQGPLCAYNSVTNPPDNSGGCFNSGTFYIFGSVSHSCQ